MRKEWRLIANHTMTMQMTSLLGQLVTGGGKWFCTGNRLVVTEEWRSTGDTADHTFVLSHDGRSGDELVDSTESSGRTRAYLLIHKK